MHTQTTTGTTPPAPTVRFGHQLRPAGPIDDLIAEAQSAEAAGFDVLTVPDHIGATMMSPLPLLAAIAQQTSTIRLSTFVLNNEMRNPVQLAWEVATLDRLSGGRVELGIGAGHTPQEFQATGIDLVSAPNRKARLREAVSIMRRLFDGETVNASGEFYNVAGAAIEAPAHARLPILIGGNGASLLQHAGAHADIVGLNGLSKTLADGQRHSVKFSRAHLEQQLAHVAAGAADRSETPEINALVQRVVITDDRERAITEAFSNDEVVGLTIADALETPYLAFGNHTEIADQFHTFAKRDGISYFVSRDIEAIAPVIELVRT